MRSDGRQADQLRRIVITPGFIKHAEGSALIEVGDTKVICTVSVEERIPQFLKSKGGGWITSEYGMLPRATTERTQRDATRGKASGRTYEIQRLIGRALRSIVDTKALGERTLWIDCDVIQADGGTRTASITGAFVALVEACRQLKRQGQIQELPIRDYIAATSVGKVGGKILLDLSYQEDSSAEVDLNLAMTGNGRFVEIQGTAEEKPFEAADLTEMIAVAQKGIQELIAIQKQVLGELQLKA
ncbi:MAG: ribonuclease PH [Vicinamibacteria bacterium]|nr:ribonuclease PH [Vicinamibacteria bacterium]